MMRPEFNRVTWAIRVILLAAALVGVFVTMAKLKDMQPEGKVTPVVPEATPEAPSN